VRAPGQPHYHLGAGKAQFLWEGAKIGNLLRTRTNADSPWSFLAALHLKFNRFAFLQPIKVELLKAAPMEEHLLAISRTNEPESAVTDDSLDCALHRHLDLRWGPFVAGRSTLPMKLPRTRVGATVPARKFVVKGVKMRKGAATDNMSCRFGRSYMSSDLNDSIAVPRSS